MSFRTTIKHFNISATILWYLACQDKPRKCADICDYLWLMHEISHENTRVTLTYMVKKKQIKRINRAMYSGILEFAI